ncbi:MAG TPA: hypothetical protein VGF53_00470 [Pseudolabrys sp.]|jgi:hypothetical protein
MDSASLYGLMSTLLVLGVLAALLVVLLVIAFARTSLARYVILPIVAVALVGLAIMSVLNRMAQDERGAERRALAQRGAELTVRAVAPGSTLACLDGAAGETVENACEKAVFGAPENTAAAVAYVAARLTLLSEGLAFARRSDRDFAASLSGLRRAIELDRFGIAAHVLAVRDGCTAERCAAFALLGDANVIKSNLKAQVFDQYVSRYAADWNKAEPLAKTQGPVPMASAADPTAPTRGPVSSKYSFPSAASIPPVSIMNAEPPLPKAAAEAQAAQPAEPAAPGPAPAPAPSKRPPVPAPPLQLK